VAKEYGKSAQPISRKKVRSSIMLILLPPSEGKKSPEGGKKLNLNSLSFVDHLTEARERALTQVPTSLSNCDEAIRVYSGVLYQALSYETLSASAKARGARQILIISALFGGLRVFDLIPNYKIKIATSLWKKPLATAFSGLDQELVVDMRSSTYLAAWIPNPMNTVGIRIFTKIDGEKKVITHMSKKYRGEIARFLIEQRVEPKSPAELHQLLKEAYKCALVKPVGKKSWFIDVIV
jgi:cytoplasmic iron level regulating protein YaaA (DUF328/UPF0246 family)